MAGMVIPASAATQYAAIDGTDIVLHKYLLLDEQAIVPNVSFNYTLAAGDHQDGSATTLEVYAGNDANRTQYTAFPTVAAVEFTPADTPVATPTPEITVPNGQKVIMKDITIALSSIKYNEPGVYRYILTEVDDGAQGIIYDPTAARTIDVYIVDNGQGILEQRSAIVYEGAVTSAPAADGTGITTKMPYYVNEYTSYYLQVSKVVTGNQGSRDEYFRFTVNISGAVAGTVYNVVGNFDTTTEITGANPSANTNPTSITVPAGATSVEQVFWLQNGQNITIQGIASGCSYSVAEDNDKVTAEGYTITAAYDNTSGHDYVTEDGTANEAAIAISNGSVSDSNLTDNASVTFTNTKEGDIPTGVLVSAGPVIIIGVVVLAGIVALVAVSSKRKASEASETETDEN